MRTIFDACDSDSTSAGCHELPMRFESSRLGSVGYAELLTKSGLATGDAEKHPPVKLAGAHTRRSKPDSGAKGERQKS